jgi:uncharacterized protein YdcH (DUF465 family)
MSNLGTENRLKEFLFNNDEQFRTLMNEHHQYETRLSELSSLQFPSEAEQVEEALLKKKKLYLKDQMEAIVHKYRASTTSH